jgi:alanine racemase
MPVRAQASVNVAAIERNVARLRRELRGGQAMCVVVKADGYGHGAAAAAGAGQAAGASWLAVASAMEAAELREAGLSGPILVLGAISREELPVALDAGADLVAWTTEFVDTVARAVTIGVRRPPVRMHVKLDSGMGRLGTRDLDDAMTVADAVLAAEPALELIGGMTHFATADGDLEFVDRQLAVFAPFAERLRRLVPGIVIHAANSGATLRCPASHFDLVRCGVAIYGLDPMNEDPARCGLEPALELTSYVAAVKRARPGESVGYGRRFVAGEETWIATLPIGYADGVVRRLTNNCDVLIDGRRYPLVGTVSMDNITVEVGPSMSVRLGESAVLIGGSGGERQTAEQVAVRAGTINYEIVCGISRRVPRSYHRDGVRL